MTYKIKYLPLAVQDLNEIARYLSGFYPKTARRVLKELREKITKLGDTPKMCEVYRLDPAYRRMVVDQYLVFYRVNDEIKTVEVHRVLRGAWNLPQYLDDLKVRLPWTMLHHKNPQTFVWGFFVCGGRYRTRTGPSRFLFPLASSIFMI